MARARFSNYVPSWLSVMFFHVYYSQVITRFLLHWRSLDVLISLAILLPLKKLLVLINTKYCTRNHVMTYTYSSVWVKSKESWYQWQWPGFWQSHQQIQMTAPTWLMRVWLSLWLSMSTLAGIDVASDTIIIITL